MSQLKFFVFMVGSRSTPLLHKHWLLECYWLLVLCITLYLVYITVHIINLVHLMLVFLVKFISEGKHLLVAKVIVRFLD